MPHGDAGSNVNKNPPAGGAKYGPRVSKFAIGLPKLVRCEQINSGSTSESQVISPIVIRPKFGEKMRVPDG
jgi:hypothetical protein